MLMIKTSVGNEESYVLRNYGRGPDNLVCVSYALWFVLCQDSVTSYSCGQKFV